MPRKRKSSKKYDFYCSECNDGLGYHAIKCTECDKIFCYDCSETIKDCSCGNSFRAKVDLRKLKENED
ncbi:MAG: hypothetical protein ABF289_00340 [Clostridiales bacterium]